MAKKYVVLMDASILMTRAMWELTMLRRKIVKNELIEPYKSLVDEDKNPASPQWLAGNDVHLAIKKAKENAALVDKITAKSSWQNPGRKRTLSADRGGFRQGLGAGAHSRSGRHVRHDSGSRPVAFLRGRGRGNVSAARGRSFDSGWDFQRRDSR